MKQHCVGSHLGRIAEALLLERKVFVMLHETNQIDHETQIWDNLKYCNPLLDFELCVHLLLIHM